MNKPNKRAALVPPLLRLQTSITSRDDRLLGWLYDHGVLTTDQIAKALFSSLDFAQRRLLRLTVLGAVTRFRPNKLDGGSHPYHYVLAQLGYEHVMGQHGHGLPKRDQARRRYQSLISRPDLPHLLGTNGVFTDLAAYERTHPGTKLAEWRPASAFHEPGALFRDGSDHRLMTKFLGLPRPDGAGAWTEDGNTVAFFVEYDTGTERLNVLTDKVAKYGLLFSYAKTWSWPVLFVLPTALRERHWHDRLHAAYPNQAPAVVVTTATDYLTRLGKTPAEDVWQVLGSTRPRRRLIELPYRDPDHDTRWHPPPDRTVDRRPMGGATA
ncbi:replication-relaxation family protein [Hamadaea sp. NPDC050747]|uniref:replication-relaxation family protein n=1 Tax=Hamadaea sp. NPDC050747 TaxID=3155789 RepID=UPI0033C33E38